MIFILKKVFPTIPNVLKFFAIICVLFSHSRLANSKRSGDEPYKNLKFPLVKVTTDHLNFFDKDSSSYKSLEKIFNHYKLIHSYRKLLILSSSKANLKSHIQIAKGIEGMIGHRQNIIDRLVSKNAIFGIVAPGENQFNLHHMQVYKKFMTVDGRSIKNLCGVGAGPYSPMTTVCETNLLKHPSDPYLGKDDIFLHEFAHAILNLGLLEHQQETWRKIYDIAIQRNLFRKGIKPQLTSYEMTNEYELFAVLSMVWFNAYNKDNPTYSKNLSDKEGLKHYFPEAYDFLFNIYDL